MNSYQPPHTMYIAALGFMLSLAALLFNLLGPNYPGLNYFPPNSAYCGFILFLICIGVKLQLGSKSNLYLMSKEVTTLFIIMSLLAFITTAVQYTPFTPIDKQILLFESWLHIDLNALMSWTNSLSHFKAILRIIYCSLGWQMMYLPLLMIALKRFDYIREYYSLLLISAILGFSFYYFFPTTAPASVISSPYFMEAQYATNLKFTQIHHYIQPKTIEGGLVSLPSFHTIWAWLCVYLCREWMWALIILVPLNLLVAVSCVLLGWHYILDIFGSMIIIILSHQLHNFLLKRKTKTLDSPVNLKFPLQAGF